MASPFANWIKRVFIEGGRRPTEAEFKGEDQAGTEVADEDTVTVPWTQLLTHAKLGEYLKLEGTIPEGHSFWVIVQPTLDHLLFLTAFDVCGTIQRTPAGQKGIEVIKPRQWLNLCSFIGKDKQLDSEHFMSDQAAKWHSDVLSAISLTNRVDYCEGNELLCHARTAHLSVKFVKAWDLPTEYALRSAQSGVSMMALNLMDSKSLAEVPIGGAPELLPSKVYVMGEGWGQSANFALTDKYGLRVFRSQQPDLSKANAQQIEQDIKHRDVVHLRLALKTPEEPGEGIDGDPIVLYRESESSEIVAHNLTKVNVRVCVKRPDGSALDCLRIVQLDADSSTGSAPSVTVEFLAQEKDYGLALWRQAIASQIELA